LSAEIESKIDYQQKLIRDSPSESIVEISR